ncbi:MAG: hypothetical protein K0U70_14735, partial [Actinomycetia bacterium]|nr:hypothetical protein [Actinomycetes bacterium]
PPLATAAAAQPVARRAGSPSRPITPAPSGRPELSAGRGDQPPGRADVSNYVDQPEAAGPEATPAQPDPARRAQPPSRNGRQSPNYQR